ncbi:TPA: hypothetical protein HA344_01320 [Candidatus Bathyarchaeota archaeon]|nr:hypothetical protein [Candidatus Bathyarchaeota archaeon]
MAKVVQTELDEKEYRLLKEVSKKKGLSIKETLRKATVTYIEDQLPLEEDPIFKVKPRGTSVKTNASRLDEQLYREKS